MNEDQATGDRGLETVDRRPETRDPRPDVKIPIEDSIDLHAFAPRDVVSVVEEYVRRRTKPAYARSD